MNGRKFSILLILLLVTPLMSGCLSGDDTSGNESSALLTNWANIREQQDAHVGFPGVISIDYSPDGSLIASGGCDPLILIQDSLTGANIHKITGNSSCVNVVTYSPDGKLLAFNGAFDSIRIIETTTWTDIQNLTHHSDLAHLSFSPDSSLLASGGYNNCPVIWDTTSWGIVQELQTSCSDGTTSSTFSPDGTKLAISTGSSSGSIKIIYTDSWELVTSLSLGVNGWVSQGALSFSPDGSMIASGQSLNRFQNDNWVMIWNTDDWTELQTIRDYGDDVHAVSFSPDGRILATGSRDDTLRLFKSSDFTEISNLSGHSNWIFDLDFSPNGKYIASASRDSSIRIWEGT
jgi:WD40 repeat protein